MTGNRFIFLLMVLTVAFGLAGIAASLYVTLVPPPPPFQYEHLRVNPAVLCPGETLFYDADVVVTRSPVSVGVTENIWDVANGRLAMGGAELHWAIFLQPARLHYTHIAVPLPLLAPGPYEYRRAGSELNSQATFASAPFTIKTCA